jgi:hypothetical protein
MGIRRRLAFQAFTLAAGLIATAAGRVGANKSYRLVKKVDPPANPASRKTSWQAALGWAAITGAATAMSGVMGRRAATGLWRDRIGRLPAGVR